MKKQIESPSATHPQQDLPNWTHLSRFQVQYLERVSDNTTANVFINGRQQVPVVIVIEGRNDNNEVVLIPDTDLAKIELILYHNQQALPATIGIRRSRDNRFVYYPEGTVFSESHVATPSDTDGAESDPVQTEGVPEGWQLSPATLQDTIFAAQTYSLWLTTTHNETLRIGARLTYPAGDRVHTCSPDVEAGGWSQGGAFNSSLTIHPQPPRPHQLSEFSIFREDISSPDQNFDIDIYTVGFADRNYLIRYVIPRGGSSEGGWFYANYVGNHKNYYHYIFLVDTTIARHYKHGDSTQLLEFPVNTRAATEGRVSLARVTESNTSRVMDADRNGVVAYVDQYGNESVVYVRPLDDGNELYLADH